MQLRTLVLTLGVSFAGAGSAVAHDDHHHEKPKPEISEEVAKTRAKQEVDRLAAAKEIDATWKEVSRLTAIEKQRHGKSWDWRVTFQNDKLQEKNVLYIFLKPSGEFVAANYTGK